MTAPTWAPDQVPVVIDDDDVDHVTCLCSPDWSLCGLDVSGLEWGHEDDGQLCALCVIAAEEAPCPRCGGDLGGGE